MEFWARDTLKRISVIQARDTTYHEWCPDGRHMMSAILSPRLRVDNGFRVFHYNGHVTCQGAFKELYQVTWRPGRYPARPVSPVLGQRPEPVVVVTGSEAAAVASSSSPQGSAAAAATVTPIAKKGAYVPPHLRNQAAAVSTGPRKLHELLGEHVDQAGTAAADDDKDGEGLSKTALKNKKKREAKRSAGEEEPLSSSSSAGLKAPVATGPNEESDLDKKIRNLSKKIKQIELLKEQQSQGKPL